MQVLYLFLIYNTTFVKGKKVLPALLLTESKTVMVVLCKNEFANSNNKVTRIANLYFSTIA